MSAGEIVRRIFVPLIDRTAPLEGPVGDAGGVLVLGQCSHSLVNFYLAKLAERSRYRLSRTEMRELIEKLSDNHVAELLERYLGKLWSADYGLIWRAPPQSSAGIWHHDNVGHRLKIFIVLANESPDNGTEFVPFTHTTRWGAFTGRLPTPQENVRFVAQRPGDVLVFDTNVMHRGLYSPKERIILQIEFSSIWKSFFVPGQCGRFLRGRHEYA